MNYKNGQETKDAIIQGSKELFLSTGYRKSTFRHIGEHVGINSPLITYYFKSKQKLAQMVVEEFYIAEEKFIDSQGLGKLPIMTEYILQNRVHYGILSQNLDLLEFYRETVQLGIVHEIFFKIEYIQNRYQKLFAIYDSSSQFRHEHYHHIELGCECEVMRFFKPYQERDEEFIELISSLLPVLIHVPQSEIDEGLIQSKKIVESIDFSQFEF